MTNENRPLESQHPARTRAPQGGALKFLGVTPPRPCPYLPGASGALDRHPARGPPCRDRLRRDAAWRLPPQPPRRLSPGLPRLPGLRFRTGPRRRLRAEPLAPPGQRAQRGNHAQRAAGSGAARSLRLVQALSGGAAPGRHDGGHGTRGLRRARRGERGRDQPRRVPQPRRTALRRLRLRCGR